ncbi:MAG: sulfite exporter TauE/SafE family protein [Gammaproteobacteria bacterium]|nr:sulfite exporter TauE/SafE family protein [Gammaproteobacteria bacterium]
MSLLILTSIILASLAYFEPCTIASHTLYTARLHNLPTWQRLLQLLLLLLIRSGLLLLLLFLLHALMGNPILSDTQAAFALLAMAVIYLLSRWRYLPIPNLALHRLLPTADKLPASLQLGLTLPSCTLPLFIIVAAQALSIGSDAAIITAALLFGIFFTLPVFILAYRGLSTDTRELLKQAGETSPYITALLLLVSVLVLLALDYGINISELKLALQQPGGFALWLGFLSGFVFSFNPVAIASIPVVLAYVTRAQEPGRAITLGGAFILAMLLTHVVLGIAAAMGGSWVQSILGRWWGLILGPLLILLGAIWLGWIRLRLPWLSLRAKKVTGIGGAFMLGIPFSVAICPFCTPALIVMLAASAASGSIGFGFSLLLAFALGRSVPIILGAISMAWLERFTLIKQGQNFFELVGGVVLILTGIYLLNEYFYFVQL